MAVDPDDMWRGTVGIVLTVVFLAILAAIAYMLYGPGFSVSVPSFFSGNATTTTESATTSITTSVTPATTSVAEVKPSSDEFLRAQEGQRFNCTSGKALKAKFVADKVHLALSDGRSLILSQTVAESGEVIYRNTDSSFIFLNKGKEVSVVENGAETYVSCTAE